MSPVSRHDARLLIVVSRGQEELGVALSFVRGQEFASRATILLPEPLYSRLGDSLPVPALRWGSADDMLAAVATYQPDLVLLCSGYLFAIEGLLSVSQLDAALRRLHDRGCRIMTSDPFLGLLPRLTLAQFDSRSLSMGQPALRRWLIRLAVRLHRKVVDIPRLHDVPHLYPSPVPPVDHAPSLVFFNPAGLPLVGADRADQGRPENVHARWLFALSDLELSCQETLLGPREFIERLLGMLRYAVEVEGQATLIAPPPIVERLRGVLGERIELLSGYEIATCAGRMLDAEYVFCWDPFSCALLPRIALGLPVFALDRGYLSRTIEPFYAAARECYLAGGEPTYVDQRRLFSPYVLAHMAKAQTAALSGLRERWQSSPTPEAIVDQALR